MSDYIKMNRREWFKQAFTKTKDASLKTTSRAAGSLADISETLKEYKWETVANDRDLTDDRPKQIMFQGKSVYLLRVDGKYLGFQGICPEDKQLIFWRAHSKQFYCPSCGSVYNLDGSCQQDENLSLTTYPARLHDEAIQLRVD
ncbi:Rieske (2Fe-2S) protein [Desulfuribacillus alkaliarsenatis]|uniref:Rieske domain-containing protein n=1 Tax=Desulfuribacillus alkaliarsenatis TaxID=766136 RepID=A0A1E5FYY3_9FIRM|nr:Rieske 2Fe-2S domain-containing protein [Desulfuribacillus alkaliarsenatis]OEF95782.1 hypothetical protein BHF68_11845 [Desulfuribacillus alkaliarsenatis]